MPESRWRIRRLEVTASTNDDVRQAAEAGASEGLVVAALRQTAGRGRQGRVWNSPEGNLYCSVLLRPAGMPKIAAFYSFAAGLAVYDAARSYLPNANIALKWPNDVLVEGKKIAGILLEVAGDALIVGIGINNAHYPSEALYTATSLVAEGAGSIELPALLDRLLDRLGSWHDRMQAEGFGPIRQAWLDKARRGTLTVRLPQETLRGDFAEIDEMGHLRLILADGAERVIATGDVLLS